MLRGDGLEVEECGRGARLIRECPGNEIGENPDTLLRQDNQPDALHCLAELLDA